MKIDKISDTEAMVRLVEKNGAYIAAAGKNYSKLSRFIAMSCYRATN